MFKDYFRDICKESAIEALNRVIFLIKAKEPINKKAGYCFNYMGYPVKNKEEFNYAQR